MAAPLSSFAAAHHAIPIAGSVVATVRAALNMPSRPFHTATTTRRAASTTLNVDASADAARDTNTANATVSNPSTLVSSPPTPGSAALPVRRFPLPHLHVGTDICHVGRVYRLLEGGGAMRTTTAAPPTAPKTSSAAARFVRRILTDEELPAVPETSEGAGGATPPESLRNEEVLPSNATASQVLAWILAGKAVRPERTAPAATKNGHDPLLWKAAQFVAGRFAAKEAAIKAHPHLDLSFHRVRIVRVRDDKDNGSGPPVAMIRIEAREGDARGTSPRGGAQAYDQEARLSISHDGEYATAVCIGFEEN